MGEALSRSVQIQISNRTRDVTLEKPRTYFYNGRCTLPPRPSVPPGSSDSCQFTSPLFKGCVGVLAYEAESFTVAIYFSNPLDYNRFSMELGLEISLHKIHLGSLEDTYARMSKGSSLPSTVTVSDRITLDTCQESARVSAGPVKVMATMSNTKCAVLRVELEKLECSGEEARIETHSPGRHYQESRSQRRHHQETRNRERDYWEK